MKKATKTPRKKTSSVSKLLKGQSATILAAVIGGVFSVAAAVLPHIFTLGDEQPSSVMEPARMVGEMSASSPDSDRIPSLRTLPNLTYGVWTIFASQDARGTDWSNSTLKITSQEHTDDGLKVAGYFDWRAEGKPAGREYIVGNYVEDTGHLFVEGQSVATNDVRFALASFSAKLTDDGRRLTEGVWGSKSGHHAGVPGRWEARR